MREQVCEAGHDLTDGHEEVSGIPPHKNCCTFWNVAHIFIPFLTIWREFDSMYRKADDILQKDENGHVFKKGN